jgi:TolC family type I secretion outer membrane protein
MREFAKLILLAVVLSVGVAPAPAAETNASAPPTEAELRAPLTLEQCVARALEHHPALKGASYDVEGARAGVGAARAAALPQVGLSGSYTQSEGTLGTSGGGASPEGYSAALSMRQLLFDSGRTPALIHEAESGRDAISATRDQVEQAVVFGARQSYFGVLTAEQVLKAQTEARALSALHLKVAQARYQEGIAPKADVTKAEVELANAELDLIRAQSGVSLAYAALSNALGLPATTSLTVTGDLQSPGAQPALETSLAFAYQNRPELKRADANLQAARSAIAVVASGTRPSLYATASTNWLDNSAVSDSGYAAGVALSFPLWDGGGTAARVRQTRAEVESAQAAYDSTKQQVGLEVQQAYLNVLEADQRVATAEKLVAQAEENYRIARGRYESGVGPMIDVVDAETALTAARTDYAQARYDAQVTRARLDLAVGNRFRPEGATIEK